MMNWNEFRWFMRIFEQRGLGGVSCAYCKGNMKRELRILADGLPEHRCKDLEDYCPLWKSYKEHMENCNEAR